MKEIKFTQMIRQSSKQKIRNINIMIDYASGLTIKQIHDRNKISMERAKYIIKYYIRCFTKYLPEIYSHEEIDNNEIELLFKGEKAISLFNQYKKYVKDNTNLGGSLFELKINKIKNLIDKREDIAQKNINNTFNTLRNMLDSIIEIVGE